MPRTSSASTRTSARAATQASTRLASIGTSGLERADAEALDERDPLARLRDRFVLDRDSRIYVDGNSLGRPPRAAAERTARLVEEWGERLVGGWHRWIDLPGRVGDLVGEAALGAAAGQVVVTDSTTVNLFKLASAALDARPGRSTIVGDAADFPTNRYVLEGIASARAVRLLLLESDPLAGPTADEVAAACPEGDVALVCLSHVAYRSGARADLAGVTDAAHGAGAMILWDVSHSAGAVPVELDAAGADLAVGCTYKYLNAGPGAPAFLYVRAEHQEGLRSPIQGWFGQQDQFLMGSAYEPARGITRFLAGTPPILGLATVEAGIEVVREAGAPALGAKAAALTELAVALADARLAPLGFSLGTPRDAARRAAHVALRHADAWRICQALIARADVVPDFRRPDSIRLGLPPLYTRFVDVWDAVERLVGVVETRQYEEFPAELARVT